MSPAVCGGANDMEFARTKRRAFVTFCESNAKALLTAYRPSKAHLRPTGWCGGFAPAVCGRLPQQGRPLKRAPSTPPKLFHSPWGREERPAAFPPCPASVLRGVKVKGFGLYCLAAISTRRYAPLTFAPAPRDSRDDRDGFFDTGGGAAEVVTAVTVVTPGEFPASAEYFSRRGYGCFRSGYGTHRTAATPEHSTASPGHWLSYPPPRRR